MLNIHGIDILLISETHFTANSQIKIRDFDIYTTNHPDGTAHGGTAIIIRSSIKHHEHSKYRSEQIQATTVTIYDKNGDFNVSSVYCPPKYKLTEETLTTYFQTLGPRFIAGGDWNSKHSHWGSRLNTTRAQEMSG